MRILLDMNLSPLWRQVLARHGHECVHWLQIGDPRAPDEDVMAYARKHGYVVFTHDLDFGAILAASQAKGPSVVQIRTQDVLPSALGPLLTGVLRDFANELEAGALIVVEEARSRVRILPLPHRG